MCDTSQNLDGSHWGFTALKPWFACGGDVRCPDNLVDTVKHLRRSWAASDRVLAVLGRAECASAASEALEYELVAAQDLLLDYAAAVRSQSLDVIAEKVELWLLSEPDSARPDARLTAADRLVLSIVADVRALAAAMSKDAAPG